MIEITKYQPEYKELWNNFKKKKKNGTFMLDRDYMDYHSDRFQDNSLMFFNEKQELIAVIPANITDNVLFSHGGLTYGGVVSDKKMTVQKMLDIFDNLIIYLKKENIKKFVYKRIPWVYYTYPSDEDFYALFRYGASLIRCDISTAIYLPERIKFNERRKRNIKKAIKSDLKFKRTEDFEQYITILSEVLKIHHNTKPVHTADELRKLAQTFPDNIKLYAAYNSDNMLAGVLIFETETTAHAQYIVNSEEGRNCGALDLVFDKLINEIYTNKKYFDFGISTENQGRYLNEGLISQKQEFGGRGVVYEFYELIV